MPTPSAQTSLGFSPETMPPTADQLWLPGYAFSAQWANAMRVVTTWPSDITYGRDGSQKRQAMRDKPTRKLETSYEMLAKGLARDMLMASMRDSGFRHLAPIVSDRTRLLNPYTGGTVLDCETRCRRLFPSQRILVGTRGMRGELIQWEIARITAVTPIAILITDALSQNYGLGSVVYPMIEANPSTPQTHWTTDAKCFATFTDNETPYSTSLPGIGNLFTDLRTVARTYEAYDILQPYGFLDGEPLVTYGVRLRSQASGTSVSLEAGQDRPGATINERWIFKHREDWWSMLAFFDYLSGPVGAFIHCQMSDLFEVVSLSGATMQVKARGPLSDWALLTHVYIRPRSVRRFNAHKIASVSRASGIDTITFTDAWPGGAGSDIMYCGPGRICRFDGESFEESWQTDEMCSVNVTFSEIIYDQSIILAGV